MSQTNYRYGTTSDKLGSHEIQFFSIHTSALRQHIYMHNPLDRVEPPRRCRLFEFFFCLIFLAGMHRSSWLTVIVTHHLSIFIQSSVYERVGWNFMQYRRRLGQHRAISAFAPTASPSRKIRKRARLEMKGIFFYMPSFFLCPAC